VLLQHRREEILVNSTAKFNLVLGFILPFASWCFLEHVVEEHGWGKDAEILTPDLYNQVKQGKVATPRSRARSARHMKGHAKEQFHTHRPLRGLSGGFPDLDAHFSKSRKATSRWQF